MIYFRDSSKSRVVDGVIKPKGEVFFPLTNSSRTAKVHRTHSRTRTNQAKGKIEVRTLVTGRKCLEGSRKSLLRDTHDMDTNSGILIEQSETHLLSVTSKLKVLRLHPIPLSPLPSSPLPQGPLRQLQQRHQWQQLLLLLLHPKALTRVWPILLESTSQVSICNSTRGGEVR